MKISSAMLRIGKLFWFLLLIPRLDIWSIHGEELCDVQVHVKRQSVYSVLVGDSFELKCPVKYCSNRPNVTWCKLNGTQCSDLEDRLQKHTSWRKEKNISFFVLHFKPVLPSDNGSYRCTAKLLSRHIPSHSVAIYVTDVTSTSGRPSEDETANRSWFLYSLLTLGGLFLLAISCFFLFCCLRRHQGKEKKLCDTAGREIIMVDGPQPFKSEQTEMDTRQNSQTLPSETEIYDNYSDPWFRMQGGSEVYSNPYLEENKQGIVYASLNHSVIGPHPRQGRNVTEAPTEYASICVRS
ncbi:B- and T-lymphocyte attenuator isoform X1 [Carlito syrichta]|uniref:B- and T-lymphocyte attenuator isoform X1 n=1 Tax=Carlito syrichta TaxID=1868482 RepID=A0A1U7UZV5_CARSF|nr:B- and T-lymphocyte attenuator isoform X1 [Carlito syrichta]